MSRDIKCVGMDVHKEAIVIAALNGSGKPIMETIAKPKPTALCSSSAVCGANCM